MDSKTIMLIAWVAFMALNTVTFAGYGIYVRQRKEPTGFWPGSTLKDNNISDVSAYNHECGNMWLGFSALMAAAGVVGVMHIIAGVIVLGVACAVALPLLISTHAKILERYRREL